MKGEKKILIPYKVNHGEIKVGDKILITLSCYNCGSPVGARWINEDKSITDDVNQGWNYCPYCGISKKEYLR